MSPAMTGLVGLGSNVGERERHICAAIEALPGIGVRPTAVSSLYDTDPVGELTDQRSFLNACVAVETELQPLQMLAAVKALERRLGRSAPTVRHGPRPIDIDILMLGGLELSHERLTLPHEQLLRRRFVLIPALELDFELRTPAGARLSDALAVLPAGDGVRFAAPPPPLPGARGAAAR